MSEVYTLEEMRQSHAFNAFMADLLSRAHETGRLPTILGGALGQNVSVITAPRDWCEENLYAPKGWVPQDHRESSVREFLLRGMLLLDLAGVGTPSGYELDHWLKGRPTLNARHFGFLMKNPHHLPEAAEGRNIFFFGTNYYHLKNGSRWVRFMRKEGDALYFGARCLANYLDPSDLIAVLR